MVEKNVGLRLAACVYSLVENCGVYGTDTEMTYDEACDALGLDDFEREVVLNIIDDDLRLV